MKIHKSTLVLSAMALILGTVGVAHAYVTLSTNAVTPASFVNYDFFASTTAPTTDATTTTATSTGIVPYFDTSGRYDAGFANLAGARQVTLYFGTVGSSTQSATFSVQVSPDAVSWYNYNMLVQNSSTSTAPGTTVSSVTSSATSTTLAHLQTGYTSFKAMRCVVVVTAAASSTCTVSATF